MDVEERHGDLVEKVLHVQLVHDAVLRGTVLVDMESNHHIVVDTGRGLHALHDAEQQHERRRHGVGTVAVVPVSLRIHRRVQVQLRGEDDGGL